MRVATYYRYSSDKWMQKEHSEARQKDKCRTFINQKRWHLVDEFSDKEVSGDDTKPSLSELQERVKTDLNIDALVIDDLSRLTRKAQLDVHEDLNWLRDHGVKLIVVRDGGQILDLEDPDTVFRLGFDVWKNNKYLKDLGAAVVDGQRTLFKEKKLGWMGPAPLGFDVVKRLKEEGPSYLAANDDLPYVTQIFEQILAGASIRSCVDILEKTERHRKKAGEEKKDPSAQSVKHLLRNSIYCGIRCLGVRNVGKHAVVSGKKERYVYNVNPLVYAAETWELDIPKAIFVEDFLRVQEILDRNKVKHPRRPATAGHRYSSLLVCVNCGGHLVANTYRDKKSEEIMISYVCAASAQKGRKCREVRPYRKQVRESELDEFLGEVFGKFVGQAEVHFQFIESLISELKTREKMGATQGGKEMEELALLNTRLDGLWKFFETQNYSSEETQHRIAKIQEEIHHKKLEIEAKVIGKTSMLEYAEEQYLLGLEAMGPARYLGCCYRVAKDVISGKLDWADKEAKLNAADEARRDGLLAPGMDINVIEYPDGSAIFSPADPDVLIEQLQTMGLTGIKVEWELGEFRGKPKHVMSALEMVFFDGNIKHIGTDSQRRLT